MSNWTKVSDRLPAPYEMVWIQTDYGRIFTGRMVEINKTVRWRASRGSAWFDAKDQIWDGADYPMPEEWVVVAWMPLPRPMSMLPSADRVYP